MIHNAINQFLQNTDWDELDYLVVDLPPGTSDSPLTVMQSLPMDGFVVVSTPQDLAVLDAKRCINMIRKLNLNVVGRVENYTGDVFGQGGGQALAAEVDAPYLGNMALRSSYRNSAMPTVLADEDVRWNTPTSRRNCATACGSSGAKPRKRNRMRGVFTTHPSPPPLRGREFFYSARLARFC